VFIKVRALETSALINRKLDSLNRDQRLIGKVYNLVPIAYAFGLLVILGSYINKPIS
jgi:hypothetical protein